MAFKMQTKEEPTVEVEINETGTPVEQEPTLPNIDGNELAAQARSLGAKVTADTEAMVDIMARGKEDWEGGPFPVLFKLQKNFTEAELDRFALPDSDTGMNPDEFKVSKENSKGKTTLVGSNFYKEFSHGTPAGQNYRARIEWCQRMQDKNAMKDDVPDDIKDMTPPELETHIAWCETRLRSMIKAYKTAMALYFKSAEVANYPGVSCEPLWVKGKEGEEVQKVQNCIQVWITPEEGKPIAKWDFFSIGAFLRLNPKKALEKGGTFAALVESGAAPRTKAGNGDKGSDVVGMDIETVETGVNFLATIHDWVDRVTGDKDQADYGKLIKLGNAKNNDEYVSMVKELKDFFVMLARDIQADAKYVKMQQANSELVKKATEQAAA